MFSAVVEPSDAFRYEVVVGAEPSFTYRSASPVPPELVNVTLGRPAGTTIVYMTLADLATEIPVTGTLLVSTFVGGGGVPVE